MTQIIFAIVTAFMILGNGIETESVLETTPGALYFVFMDFNHLEGIISFEENVELTVEQSRGITDLAYRNNYEYEDYYKILNDKGNTKEAIDEYNKSIEASQERLIVDLKNLLGDEYESFEKWFNQYWKDEGFKKVYR